MDLLNCSRLATDAFAGGVVAVLEIAGADQAIVVQVGQRQPPGPVVLVAGEEPVAADFDAILGELRADGKDQAHFPGGVPDQRHFKVRLGGEHRHQHAGDQPEPGVQRNPVNGHRPDRVGQANVGVRQTPVGKRQDVPNAARHLVGQRVQHRLFGVQIAFADDSLGESPVLSDDDFGGFHN